MGGLVVAVFNQGFTLWKERSHRRDEHQRERTRTALSVAVALESFALACSNCIDEIGRAEAEAAAQHSEDPLRGIRFPEFVMPQAPDWRWITPHLADAILGLQLKVQYSRTYIAAQIDFYTTAFEAVALIAVHARRRGARAWELAKELRKECGLPASDLAGEEWDFSRSLFLTKEAT
ncbi:hypothetical protein AWV79_35685 [Cupriavidus sp. UYMMa02A]|nr:hypothetical protein AWV79_35685 [Cupriavidus sp. UYMMa02A]